ncbi:N-acetyltransferase family protein [Hypericibacter sp.]|uniref:GNAT family N-acetyltransferase n=1 Tax=Hypericibacter sp. TaxID=2705401 RepID=UPI003D6D7E7A
MIANPSVSSQKPIKLDANAAAGRSEELAGILVDAVAGGTSVNFLWPFGLPDARRYWDRVIARIGAGEILLLAIESGGRLVGTVQLIPAPQPNQDHRVDISKLLVLRSARQQGIATVLMQAVEAEARRLGRSLLVLDTETGSAADRLYRRLGYQVLGIMPRHARLPGGELADTTFFFKHLPDASQ